MNRLINLEDYTKMRVRILPWSFFFDFIEINKSYNINLNHLKNGF